MRNVLVRKVHSTHLRHRTHRTHFDRHDYIARTGARFAGQWPFGTFGGSRRTWQALDGTGIGALPDIPVHSIVVDPDDSLRLYLGTDLGVMVSIDGGQRWMRDRSGQKLLFAFTHGRGAWRVRLL